MTKQESLLPGAASLDAERARKESQVVMHVDKVSELTKRVSKASDGIKDVIDFIKQHAS